MSLLALVATVIAASPSAEQCASAAERAAPLKREGHFTQALTELQLCVADACPRVVRDVCRSMRAEVELQVPTVAFTVQSSDRRDLLDATLLIDGAQVAFTRGVAVPLDPGVHRLEARAPEHLALRSEVVVRAGEKLRPIVLTLTPNLAATEPPVIIAKPRFPAWPGVTSSVLAVAGFGVFTGLGLHTRAQFSELQATCAPFCEAARVDAVRLNAGLADVGLVTGSIFAGLALVTWLIYGLQ